MPAFGLDRATLWEYLGHPDAEPPERRRILYALVALRVGLGLMFLPRGWSAVFRPSLEGFASRLGDPAMWGLGNATTRDLVLFLLGCTELMVGIFLIVGVFSRVSAVTGGVLILLSIPLADHAIPCAQPQPVCDNESFYRDVFTQSASLAALGGLLMVVLCGSPFLSADRFLDKVEEEERDRVPAVLPHPAVSTPILPRLTLAAALIWAACGHGQWSSPLAVSSAVFAPLLVLGLATGWIALLGGLLLAVYVRLTLSGSDAVWLLLGPLTAGAALALSGGGRLSLDRRRALRRSVAGRSPVRAEETGPAVPRR